MVFFEHWYHRNMTIENIIEISYLYWISMVFLWYFYGISMICLWYFYGISMVFLWYFYGISMVFPMEKNPLKKTSGRPSNPRARSQQLGGGQVLLLEIDGEQRGLPMKKGMVTYDPPFLIGKPSISMGHNHHF